MPAPSDPPDLEFVTALRDSLAGGPVHFVAADTLTDTGRGAEWCPSERTLYVDPTATDEHRGDAVRALRRASRGPLRLVEVPTP